MPFLKKLTFDILHLTFDKKKKVNYQLSIVNCHKGFTLVEILVGMLIIGSISFLIAAIYSAQFRLFLQQVTGIGIASQNKIALEEITNQTRQAQDIVGTCPGGICPGDNTGASVIVYRIWALDASGEPTSSTYDYIVFRQDPLNTANLIRKTYPSASSTRPAETGRVIATDLAPNGLNFSYNNADYTQVTQVTMTVTTTSAEGGKPQTISQSSKANLRNKPPVQNGPDLTVTKTTVQSLPVPRGSTLDYIVTVKNIGNQATDPPPKVVELRDNLPSGSVYRFYTIYSGSGICSWNGTYLSCDLGASWAPGQEARIGIRITTPTACGTVTNNATADQNNRITEINETNNSTSLSYTPTC